MWAGGRGVSVGLGRVLYEVGIGGVGGVDDSTARMASNSKIVDICIKR